MSLFENESVSRILTRFKKLFFILLLLPILLAGLGYFIEMNQETTSEAKAAIMLGAFPSKEEFDYTEVGAVQEKLKNEIYLKNLKEKYGLNFNAKELAAKINPTYTTGKVIELSYSTNSKDKAEEVLNELVKAFLAESKENYNDEKTFLEGEIEKFESKEGYEEVLYEMKSDLRKLRPTHIHMNVDVDEGSNNPMRRAILGFLIGAMFSISILLAPEVFRK